MRSTSTVVIRVRGHLSRRLAAAFDGMTPVRLGSATELVGEVADQAQLYGLIARVRDLGLALESVTVVEAEDERGAGHEHGRRRVPDLPTD